MRIVGFAFMLFSIGTIINARAFGQDSLKLSLDDLIGIGRSVTIKAKLAQTKAVVASNEYATFRSSLKPQMLVYGNLPQYSKEYANVTQPNGAIAFVPVNQNLSTLGLGLRQRIPLTGGEISLNADFARFEQFESKVVRYSGTPFFIRLNQPLFAVNSLKWQSKIEKLKYKESQKTREEELEKINSQAVNEYFDLLLAQINIQIAQDNYNFSLQNYETELKRIVLGTTSEDRVLQLELQKLNNQKMLEKANYDYKIALFRICADFFLSSKVKYILAIPEAIVEMAVNEQQALRLVRENRSDFVRFERESQEASRDVALAKASLRQINLTATYGYNNAAGTFSGIYRNPQVQQSFAVGFNFPILDWGRRSSALNSAKSVDQLVKYRAQIEELNIQQEVTTIINAVNMLVSNVRLAKTADSIAYRRFLISNSLFRTGKVSVSDLVISQSEKDNARLAYINALREYWGNYYLLRRLTLYDFIRNKAIVADN